MQELLSRDPGAAVDAIDLLLSEYFRDQGPFKQTELLKEISHGNARPSVMDARIGRPYSNVGQLLPVARRDPFDVDPDVVDRGNQAHARTLDALADFLRSRSIEPLRPDTTEPAFDLAWELEGVLYVAEVKSITAANEEKQLRLGLGQVLRYRQALEVRGTKVVAVLVPENRPAESGWADLCDALCVKLTWPGAFGLLVDHAPKGQA